MASTEFVFARLQPDQYRDPDLTGHSIRHEVIRPNMPFISTYIWGRSDICISGLRPNLQKLAKSNLFGRLLPHETQTTLRSFTAIGAPVELN